MPHHLSQIPLAIIINSSPRQFMYSRSYRPIHIYSLSQSWQSETRIQIRYHYIEVCTASLKVVGTSFASMFINLSRIY